jgi:hypothetical protein
MAEDRTIPKKYNATVKVAAKDAVNLNIKQ